MDDLTARLVAQEDERERNPADWHVTLRCAACGGVRVEEYHKTEIVRYRTARRLPDGSPVTIETLDCPKCETATDDEEA